MSHNSPIKAITSFNISPIQSPNDKVTVSAVVVPKVTCDLPHYHIPFDTKWKHLSDLPLADPDFGKPGRVDVLLGVDVFTQVLLHGRRVGLINSPVGIETKFGWIIAGATGSLELPVVSHHTTIVPDDFLKRFWEIEEPPNQVDANCWSMEERAVMKHFETHHSYSSSGRFIVPLPRKQNPAVIGESRTQAVRRFLYLERSLSIKGISKQFNDVINEYFDEDHAERVPEADLKKVPSKVFYLPMHIVH